MKHEKNFWTNRIRESAVLNPVDRIAEVLFGLIMVLTFTGAISVAKDGRDEISNCCGLHLAAMLPGGW